MLPGGLNGPGLAKRAVAMQPGLKVFNSAMPNTPFCAAACSKKASTSSLSKPFRKHQLANKIAEVR